MARQNNMRTETLLEILASHGPQTARGLYGLLPREQKPNNVNNINSRLNRAAEGGECLVRKVGKKTLYYLEGQSVGPQTPPKKRRPGLGDVPGPSVSYKAESKNA